MRIIRLNGKDDTAKGCGDWVRCIQPSIDGQSILIALNNVRTILNEPHSIARLGLIYELRRTPT